MKSVQIVSKETEKTYVIKPKDSFEAAYGKAVLVTDTMIAQILDLCKGAKAKTDEGQEALDDIWDKFMSLWEEDCPCDKEGKNV